MEAIEAHTNALATASHKLAEQMYQAEQAKTGGAEAAAAGGDAAKGGDDVVDALEFTEVKDQ